MLVFSVAILGVVGSMGLSMQLVGDSRQQSSGVGVATERLERIHDIPYERIGLNDPAPFEKSSDPDHPDFDITFDPAECSLPPSEPADYWEDFGCYRLADGGVEPILANTETALSHIDDPITVGNTEFKVFQYVTAGPDLDGDNSEDYRRVTVVVVWKHPVQSGTTDRAVQSTIITPGTVTVPTPTPTPLPTAAAPTASPASCSGGLGGMATGTMSIISGSGAQEGFTDSTSVQVTLDPADNSQTNRAELANGPEFHFFAAVTWDWSDPDQVGADADANGNPDTFAPATVAWTVPVGDGTKTIQARFRGADNKCSNVLSSSVTLDQTPPATPADWETSTNLRISTCTGPPSADRDLTVTWNAASDANLLGYRLYRSIDSGSFEAISTVGGQTASDTTAKNHNSIRYRVRAYDRAGNESDESNTLSFSKNSC